MLVVIPIRDGSRPRLLQGRYSIVGDRAKGDRIMTEASSGAGGTRPEIEGAIVRRSLEDEDFRQRLLEDPKAAVEEELGSRLPDAVQVRAVEESADTIYLVLPSASALGEELSDWDLEKVTGGGSNTWNSPTCSTGGPTTVCGAAC
jgi:Nitrile hydratase, alpha chain